MTQIKEFKIEAYIDKKENKKIAIPGIPVIEFV